MSEANPFKWHHYEAEIIVLCVRWYLRYSLSYRDLEEMMREGVYRLITREFTDGYSPLRVGVGETVSTAPEAHQRFLPR